MKNYVYGVPPSAFLLGLDESMRGRALNSMEDRSVKTRLSNTKCDLRLVGDLI